MSKPKQIGTAAESAVVTYLISVGLNARREVLHGGLDQGDVRVELPGGLLVVIEVKGGAAAETASLGQVQRWLGEVDVERDNARADLGFLVRKRRAVGTTRTGLWHLHCWTTACSCFSGHLSYGQLSIENSFAAEFTLADLPALLHR